jgi:hypothetical protein
MDDDATGRWLTYAELAEARGITRKAAARLTLRHRWRRQPGNDGVTRVLVPDAKLAHRQSGRHDAEPQPLIAQAVAALETAVMSLTDQLAKAEGRATTATARAEQAEARANQARAEAEEALQGAERLRQADATHSAEVAGLRVQTDEALARAERAEGERDQAREAHAKAMAANRKWEAAETARKARGRLRRAWDGWRRR